MDAVTVLSSLLKVAAVLALLVLSLRLLGRYQGTRGPQRGLRGRPESLIEILEQSRLGRNAGLAAVRVGDRVLLLGTTESSIETLADVTDNIDLTVDDDEEDDPVDQSVLHHAVDLLRSGNFQQPIGRRRDG